MSATAAPPTRGPGALRIYRDDGPLARALAGAGRRLPVPPAALVMVGALPLLALAAPAGAPGRAAAGAAAGWLVVCAGAGAGRPHDDPLNWLVPPLLRAAEYGAILWLASLESATAVAAGFVLLAAVAFRQYDLVYRLRHRAAVPPRWVSLLGLGWDGRVVLVWLLLLAGALPGALYVAGGVLACAFVAESAAGWLAYARSERTVVRDGEDDEDEDQ